MYRLLLVLLVAALWGCSSIMETPRQHASHVPATLLRQVKTGIDLRDYQYIVIHHTQTRRGHLGAIEYDHRYTHRYRSQWGCKYQFVIGNGTDTPMGFAEPSRRWIHGIRGGHVSPSGSVYNDKGIAICLVGDYRYSLPPESQVTALQDLIRTLRRESGKPLPVKFHKEVVSGTDCPGKVVNLKFLKQEVGVN